MDLDLDFQEGFDLFESNDTQDEPEWVLLNRKWSLEHPWIHNEKHPRDVLDSWAICETPSTPDSFRDFSNPDENQRSKKCFIDKIDLKSLVEDPESFNIDYLFAEPRSSFDSRKKWERLEEIRLLQFLNSRTGKNSLEMWKDIAKQLGRSVNSVRIKAAALKKVQNSLIRAKRPTIRSMISTAIHNLPLMRGTKSEIIHKIEETFGNIQQNKWKESVKQVLNMFFVKVPGTFKLRPSVQALDFKKCLTMNDYITWTLSKFGPLTKSELKSKISDNFSQFLSEKEKNGVKVWQQTFSKKLKSCKNLDISGSKTTFKVS
jgi:hypothetical protein